VKEHHVDVRNKWAFQGFEHCARIEARVHYLYIESFQKRWAHL
jgi:hypothetical protein